MAVQTISAENTKQNDGVSPSTEASIQAESVKSALKAKLSVVKEEQLEDLKRYLSIEEKPNKVVAPKINHKKTLSSSSAKRPEAPI